MTEATKENHRAFNPQEHIIQIKTKDGLKDYLPIMWRLVWFRKECPEGIIKTTPVTIDPDRETEEEGYAWNDEKKRSEKVTKHAKGFAVFHASVQTGRGGEGQGTKSEKAAAFPDWVEKSETGAIGRALATLGFGTQFSDEEFFEGERYAASPGATREASSTNGGAQTQSTSAAAATPALELTSASLKVHFGKAFHVGAQSLEERWKAFKVYALHEGCSDEELDKSPHKKGLVHGAIIAHEKGIDKHAAQAKAKSA